jgi:short-subunit dehydrogenase
MNLLLVALPGKELDDLVKEIKTLYKVHCYALGIDLSVTCSPEKIWTWVTENNFKVNILINNVGIGSKGSFETFSPDFYFSQINLNIVSALMLSRLFLPLLRENAPAHILNVGSMGGFYVIPDKTVYSASKAFIYSFSRSLRAELKTKGVKVSVLCPGGTDSNAKTIAINKDLKGLAKWSILNAEQVAKAAINGMLKNEAVIIPGSLNKVSYTLSQFIPEFIKTSLVTFFFKRVSSHKY